MQLVRNDFGDTSALDGHAHDADVIMGDNADIFRLLDRRAARFRTFAYDNYSTVERIIPRAFRLLDYVEGAATGNVGAADLVHGEAGDDTIHGQTGNDVLFGEGQDDDIVGGTGFDRIYGGTGQDGLLGDDGKMLTSRNGIAEPLNRLPVAEVETFERLPRAQFIGAVVDILGELKKRAMLAVAHDRLERHHLRRPRRRLHPRRRRRRRALRRRGDGRVLQRAARRPTATRSTTTRRPRCSRRGTTRCRSRKIPGLPLELRPVPRRRGHRRGALGQRAWA